MQKRFWVKINNYFMTYCDDMSELNFIIIID